METSLPAAATAANPYAPPVANPYAPPRRNPYAPPGVGSDDEATRRELLKTEASIRSLGMLWWIGGVVSLAFAALILVGGLVALFGSGEAFEAAGVGILGGLLVLYGLLGFGQIWAGRGLRRLDPRVKTISVIFLAFGLLGFPLGTLISAYFLFLLFGEKGKRVLTTEYQRIVAATPHIKYHTPAWVWLVVGLLGLLLVAAILLAAA